MNMTLRRYLKAPLWLVSRNPYRRMRVLQELARLSAGLFGDFPVMEAHRSWREDRGFLQQYRRLSPENPYSQDRKFTLREFARYTQGVPGDIAECGCYKGASAWFMATAAPGIHLHLFDSFAGLSAPDSSDQQDGSDVSYWSEGDLSATEQDVAETLKEFQNIHIYKGWIPERFDEVKDLVFRLVHIDVDLYQPTLDSLEFFYPRLSKGGVIVLDDYGSSVCPGAREAADRFARQQNEHILHLPTGQGILCKRIVA